MITIKNTDNTCKCCTPEIDIDVDNQSTGANIDVDTEVVPVEIDKRDGDYNNLINKPKINGEILKGDKTGDELGLVDKTTEPNRVYGTDDEGCPTTIPYSEKADKEYIVRRDENGDVIVPQEPGKDDSATSKKYVDDAIDAALEEATVFKGIFDNQTLLPTIGNRNGDMYWIRKFVEPVPEGMIEGHSGTAIFNGILQEFQFKSDEIYDPDLKSIIFDSENKLSVQLSNQEDNIIQFTENGLYASTSDLEQALEDALNHKVSTTTEHSKVYGTDNNGDQVTYDYNSFGKVDDVKVGGTSVVTNKIANLGTMAGESSSDYTKTANLAQVALDNDYESLNNKPTIGEAVLNLKRNGTSVGTFSANATENTTINVEVPRIIIRRL